MVLGNSDGVSFPSNLDALCAQLLVDFLTEEESKAIDPGKYRAAMHGAVKKRPS